MNFLEQVFLWANFNIDGEVTNNPSEVSNGLVSYYTSVITELKKHLFP